jgi:hypothetical protein
MLAHNALDSRMIIDQLGPLLPKDNENVNAPPGHARCSYHGEPTPECGDRRQGQDPDHRQSSRRESASSITLLKECDCDQDKRDFCDIICNRYACDRIENRRQERDRIEHKQREERVHDYYGPYYDQPHR